MPIISLSSQSYTNDMAIAQEACSRLKYQFVGPELYREASERSGTPVAILERALTEPIRPLGFAFTMRQECVAHVQAAVSAHGLQDNVLFQCPFGAHMIQGVSHLLKVRLCARIEDRVALKSQREGCSLKASHTAIAKEDKGRLELASKLFGADEDSEDVYDLVLDSSRLDMGEAVEAIVDAARNSRYSPTTYSVRRMEDQELGHRIRAVLVDLDPNVVVQVESRNARVRIKAHGWSKKKTMSTARERTKSQGVEKVTIEAARDLMDRAADLY